MQPNLVLIIGTVWPEPSSTAAGSRMLQLIQHFQLQKWKVVFASSASFSEFMFDLKLLDVATYPIELNNSAFDDLIQQLNPDFVVFDRFMTEEQYGWRVAENCPKSIRILNTEDLHFLRTVRQDCYKKNTIATIYDMFKAEITKREIASIYRSDCSLIISKFETELLVNEFKIDSDLLLHLPFLIEPIAPNYSSKLPKFEERQHFISIGNFRHEPNWKTVLILKEKLWPLIRKKLPKAELHVYGSYISEKALQLHNVSEGFLVKGRAESAKNQLANAKVLLAPIPFGAGIKGKLTDAMESGTPSVTTTIGAEGMHSNLNWNGFISNDYEEMANAAVVLYQDTKIWIKAQKNGFDIINQLFNKDINGQKLNEKLNYLKSNINETRTKNFIGQMLHHHSLKSTKYLSKWIEEKNKH